MLTAAEDPEHAITHDRVYSATVLRQKWSSGCEDEGWRLKVVSLLRMLK